MKNSWFMTQGMLSTTFFHFLDTGHNLNNLPIHVPNYKKYSFKKYSQPAVWNCTDNTWESIKKGLLEVDIVSAICTRVGHIRLILFLFFTAINISRNILGTKHVLKDKKLHFGRKRVSLKYRSQYRHREIGENVYAVFL